METPVGTPVETYGIGDGKFHGEKSRGIPPKKRPTTPGTTRDPVRCHGVPREVPWDAAGWNIVACHGSLLHARKLSQDDAVASRGIPEGPAGCQVTSSGTPREQP